MTEDRPTPDGGETAAPLDVQRAGASPPDAPTADGLERLLPDLLDGTDDVSGGYLVRAGLAPGSGRKVGERLVGALEDKVTVVGTTLEAGFDPANPELDALIETDHDHGAIAASLSNVGPVEGVVVADVSAAVERELEDDGIQEQVADANDVFNELQEEVGQEGYGDVVDELEDVSFPGGPDPDEEVDLEEEVGVDLQDGADGASASSGDGSLDMGGGDMDAIDDDVGMDDLLGESDDGDDGDGPTPPDQQAIEEAIEDVELDAAAKAGEPTTPEVEEPTVPEPDDEPATAGGEAANPTDADPAAPGDAAVPDDMAAFVDELTRALESGAIDEDRRTELREALGIESTHSLDVRLEYLQKRVDNLAAYTDAWESFLSQEGSGREFMENVRGDLEQIESRLDAVEAGGGGGAALDDVERRLDDISSSLSAVEEGYAEEVSRLDTRVDDVESRLDQRLGSVEEAVEALQTKVRKLLKWREHVRDILGE